MTDTTKGSRPMKPRANVDAMLAEFTGEITPRVDQLASDLEFYLDQFDNESQQAHWMAHARLWPLPFTSLVWTFVEWLKTEVEVKRAALHEFEDLNPFTDVDDPTYSGLDDDVMDAMVRQELWEDMLLEFTQTFH